MCSFKWDWNSLFCQTHRYFTACILQDGEQLQTYWGNINKGNRNKPLLSLSIFIDYVLALINRSNISSRVQRVEWEVTSWHKRWPPADLEPIELETLSVGAPPLPEHHAVTLDWISLKGNHLPKSVLTPPYPPAKLGQPVPLVPCQGYNWHRRQQVPLSTGQGTILQRWASD